MSPCSSGNRSCLDLLVVALVGLPDEWMGTRLRPMTAISQISGSRLCHWSSGLVAASCLNNWSYLVHDLPLPSLGRLLTMDVYPANSKARCGFRCTATAM